MCARIEGISSIVEQLRYSKKPLILALFFLAGLLVIGQHFLGINEENQAIVGVLGGPERNALFIEQSPYVLTAFADNTTHSNPPLVLASEKDEAALIGISDIQKTAFADENSTIFNSPLGAGGIFTYKVKRGDTISKIARTFGVAAISISNINPGLSDRKLQVGQEIKVVGLNNAGLGGPAASSRAEQDELAIAIAGAKKLPRIAGYFIEPTKGFNWGILHSNNAVDIANACGTPVYAAAEGLIAIDKNIGSGATGWNDGYGHFVLIEHPNGTKTRYAHLDQVSVEIGDYVTQGKQIGTMGNTGNVHGPTGCHLHFEVYSAQNPFVK